ncbi:phosphoribosylaminoimidazole carboxylase ATPase subunit [Lactococcus termiticola]|uniref:N5-carboxyaminoimidazole ribonucleotide synthase n=2 Tax=Lactococcus termiticola TaxID=2169526 RepID=A0A2R5HGH2_9LACT|nr:5-(carboxyamino)imidazole ribonucleotide synthase [Lactococcus termiticola]GBG97114.1 phosphoribosylaminoimidazole carboxylase ATPase subunit [Lactococcus termiticola]
MENKKKTIGIIGGGQLGQMMAISAQYMGHKVISLDPNPNCSAAKTSDELIQADYDDVNALLRMAYASDVVTYEFENVSAEALREIEEVVAIPQSIKMLEITQNRKAEKTFLASCGVNLADWSWLDDPKALPEQVVKKQVLKTTTGGYDGHGQVVIKTDEDLVVARDLLTQTDCVLEDFVAFEQEISVIMSGNGQEVVFFPIAENDHRENILHRTIAPARISKAVEEKAYSMALMIAKKLKLAGTLCVEMFLTAEGELYVNELAPRPHNSGHYTIEACDFSQFDLHIKGILGEALPEPELLKPALMMNVLGQHVAGAEALKASHPAWHQHDYGKPEAKHNRKMGHITILTDDMEASLQEIKATGLWETRAI